MTTLLTVFQKIPRIPMYNIKQNVATSQEVDKVIEIIKNILGIEAVPDIHLWEEAHISKTGMTGTTCTATVKKRATAPSG